MSRIATKEDLLNDIYSCKIRLAVEEEIKEIISKCSLQLKKALYDVLCLKTPSKKTLKHNKRFRPYLIELSSKAAGLEMDDAFVKPALWVEMKHQASLIIDDIQDGSIVRCEKESAWKKYGLNTALDFAYYIAASCEPSNLAKSYFGTNGRELHDYSMFKQECLGNMVCGQELDLEADKGGKSIEKNYFEIADGKTGALINLALHFGTMPYEYLYSTEKSKTLTKFSMIFARLYQIMDDVEDIKDVKNGKEGAKLDSSNIYFYLKENHVKLSKLRRDLKKGLIRTHNKLKKLGVIKNDEMFERLKILINTANSGKN